VKEYNNRKEAAMSESASAVERVGEDALKEAALGEVDQVMSERHMIPLEEVQERRRRIMSMFDMLRGIEDGGMIVGEGFYIKREPTCFTVFRRGAGIQHVAPRVVTVSTMFTPKMFFEGIR
jgi:hypothetical protein